MSNNFENQFQLQQQYQYQQQNIKQPTNMVVAEQTNTKPIQSSNVYLTLLGLADTFLKANQFKLAIHSLESILTLKYNDISVVTNFHIQLKTRISLCRLYLNHTLNTNQYVNAHLEKALILVQNLNLNDEYKYEATYLIYKIFQKQKLTQFQLKQNGCNDPTQMTSLFNLELVKKILETSGATYPVWHLRLIFLISDILTHDRDFNNAAFFMTIGIEFCAQNRISSYTHILFILCKGLIHLLQRNPAELQNTMQPCAALIENFQTTNIQQVESLKIFFLVLQVTYFLQCGQMKSVKNTLKNLQHYVQSLSGRVENENEIVLSQNPLENFQWLNKDHLGILVYLLTIVHSVQTGSYEKAQKLIEKAMVNIQKCKLKEQTLNSQSFTTYNSSFITNAFHYMFLENMIRCNITVGNRSQAIRQIGDLFQICDTDSRLMNSFSPQLHCLVGIYCLSMNLKEQALSHFNHSLKSTLDTDLWLFNAMNSAICYLNSMSSNHNIKNQLLTIMENLMPENIQTQNSALTAVSHFFRALRFYLNGNYQQAKTSLRETILLANSEELTVITTNSYIFMGHIDYLMSQFQESFEELNNGSEMAEKNSEFSLKIYSNTLLRDIFKYFNDPRESDMARKYSELEKDMSIDHYDALKMPHHCLIEWNSNSSPVQLLANIQRNNMQPATLVQNNQQTPIINQPSQSQQAIPQQYLPVQSQQVYNNYNSPVNQQIQQQRLSIISPQQQYNIMHQQKMSPQAVNSPNYHQIQNSPNMNINMNHNQNNNNNNVMQPNNFIYQNQIQQQNIHHQQLQYQQQQQLLIQQQQQQQQQNQQQQHLMLNHNQVQHNHHR